MRFFRIYPPAIPTACALAVLLFSCPDFLAGASRSTTTETRLACSWEYDDNVFQESSGQMGSGAGLVSLFSRILFRYPATLTQFNCNIGYKDHYRLSEEETRRAGDILAYRLSLDSEKRFSANWFAGTETEFKQRHVYRKSELDLLSEEGYLRGSGKLYARRNLHHKDALTFSYRYSFFDFDTFKSFNYGAHGPSLKYSRNLSPRLTGSVSYTLTRRGYKREVFALDHQGSLVQLPIRQNDNHHQFDFSVGYSGAFLANFIYSLQNNDSNSYGFSYWNNRFIILLAGKLPRDFFLNAYLFFEIKRYSDKVSEPILIDIITGENDNNGAVIKLSKPLGPVWEGAATFSFYRNESSIRDLNFRKSLINLGLTCRF